MTTVLQIDASARSGRSSDSRHGSRTRRLTHRFVEAWRALSPEDPVLYRDIGTRPPRPVSGDWIQAAFTPPASREPWMREVLGESDTLVAEVKAADIIVIGAPMYNFGPPAQLKAWIDNIVRVGLTFGFDRAREGEPYWPMLAGQGKTLVILTSRGDYGYDAGGRIADLELVIPSLAKPWPTWASRTRGRWRSNTTSSPTTAWRPRSGKPRRASMCWRQGSRRKETRSGRGSPDGGGAAGLRPPGAPSSPWPWRGRGAGARGGR